MWYSKWPISHLSVVCCVTLYILPKSTPVEVRTTVKLAMCKRSNNIHPSSFDLRSRSYNQFCTNAKKVEVKTLGLWQISLPYKIFKQKHETGAVWVASRPARNEFSRYTPFVIARGTQGLILTGTLGAGKDMNFALIFFTKGPIKSRLSNPILTRWECLFPAIF